MSKPKPKDKKNQSTSALQKQFEAQRRDIIEYEYTIKKLEQRLADTVLENERKIKELEQLRMLDLKTIEGLQNKAITDQLSLDAANERMLRFEEERIKWKAEKYAQDQTNHIEKLNLQTELQTLKVKIENQPKMLLKQIEDLKHLDRQKYQLDILNLKDAIEYEKAEKTRQLADKEREKVQATDKLRKEMLKKIEQMRQSLLFLKEQQLSTTTRLTILQNHQLTSQLEYQSKQTQKLIFKEEQMSEKIKQLTQQLAIHKQVQEELAKRSHFSKGVIKKLNERIAELEKQVDGFKNSGSRAIESGKNITQNHTSVLKSKIYIESVQETNTNKQLLAEVQKQLSQTQKKLSEAQSKLQATQKQRDSLQNQVKRYENSCNQLAKILNKNSELNNTASELADPVLRVDLEELRNKKVDQWSQDQISLVVKIMLNLIKPYLTKKNILIPAIRRLLVVEDSRLDKVETKLPKITVEMTNQNASKGLKDLPTNIASKIVGSNLREWGSTVNLTQNALLKKKYKLNQQSHR